MVDSKSCQFNQLGPFHDRSLGLKVMDSSKSPYNPHSNAKTETSTHPPLLSDSTTHTQYPEDALQPVTNSMHDTNIDSNSRMDIAPSTNGFPDTRDMNDNDFPSLEELEKELPFVGEGQVHLGLVIHQMVQDLYASLLNIAETYVHFACIFQSRRHGSLHFYQQSSAFFVSPS